MAATRDVKLRLSETEKKALERLKVDFDATFQRILMEGMELWRKQHAGPQLVDDGAERRLKAGVFESPEEIELVAKLLYAVRVEPESDSTFIATTALKMFQEKSERIRKDIDTILRSD